MLGQYTYIQYQILHDGGSTNHIPIGRGFDASFGYFSAANDYHTEVVGHVTTLQSWTFGTQTSLPPASMGLALIITKMHALIAEHMQEHDPSTLLFLYYAPHIAYSLEVPDRYAQKLY